jgi:hypothetical protein
MSQNKLHHRKKLSGKAWLHPLCTLNYLVASLSSECLPMLGRILWVTLEIFWVSGKALPHPLNARKHLATSFGLLEMLEMLGRIL